MRKPGGRFVACLGLSLAVLLVPDVGVGQESPGGDGAEVRGAVGDDDLAATLKRTWRGQEITMIDGLAEVPLSMMAGSTADTYRFELVVSDAEDTELYRDSWERELSKRATAHASIGASTILEAFQFAVKPGRYELELLAYPIDAADLGVGSELPFEAFEQSPMASDLFLADRVEPLDEGGGGSWSITHGGFGIAAVARTTMLPREPELYYYIELYAAGAEPGSTIDVSAVVIDSTGRSLYTTPARSVEVVEGGQPFAGSLSVAGLPPGVYRLELIIDAGPGSGSVTRDATFRMLDAQTGARTLATSYESEYFESLSAEEIEATFGGVGYLVSESERQAYQSLPMDAKRRYLAEFFASQNPSPGTASNSFLEEYLERVGTARGQYGELIGTGERPPWSTDAGRIYIRFGEPDERVVNHFPFGADHRAGGASGQRGESPYEIWSYHATGFVYLFVEETQFGDWRMVFTNDPGMRSLADWQDRVGGEALRDLSNKFGIQPRF